MAFQASLRKGKQHAAASNPQYTVNGQLLSAKRPSSIVVKSRANTAPSRRLVARLLRKCLTRLVSCVLAQTKPEPGNKEDGLKDQQPNVEHNVTDQQFSKV